MSNVIFKLKENLWTILILIGYNRVLNKTLLIRTMTIGLKYRFSTEIIYLKRKTRFSLGTVIIFQYQII